MGLVYRGDKLTRKLDVVHISPTYMQDLVGGGERYPWELTKALSKYANTCLIIFGKNRYTERVTDTLTIEKYPAKISPPPLFTRTNPFPLTRSFFNKIDNADIVHVHQFNTLVSNLAISYGRLKNKRICVTDHGGGYIRLANLFPIIGKSVDSYMSVSKFSYLEFSKYKKHLDLIYGGVDTSQFYPLNMPKMNEVLCVGKILPVKGINTLIKAVQGLNTTLKIDAKLLDNNYLKLMIDLDKNHSTIFNFNASDQELVIDYNQALATVIPSLSETLSLVLLESMACGTPVICTNVGGMPEIVKDGENGFIVPPENPDSMRERIKYFIEDPTESKKMGERARKKVLEYFTWDAVANRCMNGYSNLI